MAELLFCGKSKRTEKSVAKFWNHFSLPSSYLVLPCPAIPQFHVTDIDGSLSTITLCSSRHQKHHRASEPRSTRPDSQETRPAVSNKNSVALIPSTIRRISEEPCGINGISNNDQYLLHQGHPQVNRGSSLWPLCIPILVGHQHFWPHYPECPSRRNVSLPLRHR